jgi:hypothetical protein
MRTQHAVVMGVVGLALVAAGSRTAIRDGSTCGEGGDG